MLASGARVLYLGAATGTTVSHVSDIACDGLVYAVELSPRSMRDLVRLCERRENIFQSSPMLLRPKEYAFLVEPVDRVDQDVAQRNQAEIASRNCARYLKPGGDHIQMLKTRSKTSGLAQRQFSSGRDEKSLRAGSLGVMDLLPFHQDHWAIQAK